MVFKLLDLVINLFTLLEITVFVILEIESFFANSFPLKR